jgi:hypothetical protein
MTLKNLEELWLNQTEISDSGLGDLRHLKKLRSISVTDTQVTDAGIAALREALPGLEVRR